MAFINIQANFAALVSILGRIADALERAVGPVPTPRDQVKKRGPEAIVQYGNEEREWAKDHFRNTIHEQGFAADREESLMKVAMKRYDYEQRHQDPNQAEM